MMRLAAWRKAEGKTQEWLADQLGCTQSYISQIERAEEPIIPRRAVMLKIVRLTGGAVQPNDFYDLPQSDAPPEAVTFQNDAIEQKLSVDIGKCGVNGPAARREAA